MKKADKYKELFSKEYLMGPNSVRLLEEMLEKYPLERGMRVLDLGCGKGLTSLFLAKEADVNVFATDLWISATENNTHFNEWQVSEKVIPIHADANDLPFAEEYFDAVVSTEKVMRPLLDWSFKYLFGTEESKPNLIGFLNLMLNPKALIIDVQFMNNESLPVSAEHKGCVFDILCKDTNEDRFLIEIQTAQAVNIVDRIIYYTCRLIDRMGKKGSEWDYKDIKKVYYTSTIALS